MTFKPLSARTLTFLAYLVNGTLAQITKALWATEEDWPVVASRRRDPESDGRYNPSVLLATTATASTEPSVKV